MSEFLGMIVERFRTWVALHPAGVELDSVVLCFRPDGGGWVVDEGGSSYVEFESALDGALKLEKLIKTHLSNQLSAPASPVQSASKLVKGG